MGFCKERFYPGHLTNISCREESHAEKERFGVALRDFIFSYLIHLYLIYFLNSPNIFESVLMTYPRIRKNHLLWVDVVYRIMPAHGLSHQSPEHVNMLLYLANENLQI